jgi:hypothetical protein
LRQTPEQMAAQHTGPGSSAQPGLDRSAAADWFFERNSGSRGPIRKSKDQRAAARCFT